MKRGMQMLDEVKPGWVSRVDLDRFNVVCARSCPLYYAYRDEFPPERENYFLEVAVELFDVRGARELYEQCLYLGFDSDVDNDLSGEIITGVWHRELEKRRGNG
jgi:hypothetical protein